MTYRLLIALLLALPALAQIGPLSVPNMAALRNLVPNPTKPVYVEGYYRQGDGGGGYYWVTNTVVGTNAYGGRILAAGGGKSWELSADIVNPKQFGAIGDGTTDDTEKVLLCISFARGGVTSHSDESYAVINMAVTNARPGLRFSGLRLKRLPTSSSWVVAFTNLSNATFEGCFFDGRRTNVENHADLISFFGCTNIAMVGNQFIASTGQNASDLLTFNGIYTTVDSDPVVDGAAYKIPTVQSWCENITVTGNTFRESGGEGIQFRYGTRRFTATGNSFWDMRGTGITVKGNEGNVTGNTFWYCTFGTEVNNEDMILGQGTDIVYVGNNAIDCIIGYSCAVGWQLYQAAINTNRSNGLTFEDYMPRRITVSDMNIKDATHCGVFVLGAADIKLENINIHGVNTNRLLLPFITSAFGNGIFLWNVNNGQVDDCVIQNTVTDSIYWFTSTNTHVRNCVLNGQVVYTNATKNFWGRSRVIDSSRCSIQNSIIRDTYIDLAAGDQFDLIGNLFESRDPFSTSDLNTKINVAISVDGLLNNSTFSDNVIRGTATSPIRIRASVTNNYPRNLVIQRNNILNGGLETDSAYQGIEIRNGTNIITRENTVQTLGVTPRMSHAVKIYPETVRVASYYDRAVGLVGGSVWDQAESAASGDYQSVSLHRRLRNNMSGMAAVTNGQTQVQVTFRIPEQPNTWNNELYKPFVTARWNTTVYCSSFATTGFLINFGTPAPADGFVSWRIE